MPGVIAQAGILFFAPSRGGASARKKGPIRVVEIDGEFIEVFSDEHAAALLNAPKEIEPKKPPRKVFLRMTDKSTELLNRFTRQ